MAGDLNDYFKKIFIRTSIAYKSKHPPINQNLKLNSVELGYKFLNIVLNIYAFTLATGYLEKINVVASNISRINWNND